MAHSPCGRHCFLPHGQDLPRPLQASRPHALPLLPGSLANRLRQNRYSVQRVVPVTGACAGHQLTGTSTGAVLAASCWTGGLSTLVEKKSRRMELAFYCLSRVRPEPLHQGCAQLCTNQCTPICTKWAAQAAGPDHLCIKGLGLAVRSYQVCKAPCQVLAGAHPFSFGGSCSDQPPYSVPQAVESFALCLKEWRWVRRDALPRRIDVVLFAAATAAIMHCYSDDHGAPERLFGGVLQRPPMASITPQHLLLCANTRHWRLRLLVVPAPAIRKCMWSLALHILLESGSAHTECRPFKHALGSNLAFLQLIHTAGTHAVLCFHDAGTHREVFRSKYLNVLDFVFGNTGTAGSAHCSHL